MKNNVNAYYDFYRLLIITPWRNPIDKKIYSFMGATWDNEPEHTVAIMDELGEEGKKYISKYDFSQDGDSFYLTFTNYKFKVMEINKEVIPNYMILLDSNGVEVRFENASPIQHRWI